MELEYLDEFRGCAVDPTRTPVISATEDNKGSIDHFYGILINKDFNGNTETNRIMYPIMHTRTDQLFFGFGFDFFLRGYLFPGIGGKLRMLKNICQKLRFDVDIAGQRVV